MATVLAPFGLRPCSGRGATNAQFQVRSYWIKAGYATAIGFGDPVVRQSSGNQGYIALYANGGSHILGVFAGIVVPFYDNNVNAVVPSKMYYAGTENPNGDIQCLVVDDQNALYEIQVNGGPVVISDLGLNADIVVGTPTTGTGISTAKLDYSNKGTTATFPLRIVDIAPFAWGGIDPTQPSTYSTPSANNIAIVTLNTSEYRQTTGI